jgi:hypothetical protein
VKGILRSRPSVPDTIVGGGRVVAELRRAILAAWGHDLVRKEGENGEERGAIYRHDQALELGRH